ncbi:RNA polymerase III Rpc4 [Cordyceps fumosorosea ARSEF 2679]|uniref:RNA polymerase III Rpc4 n=1 Tax=Cordyceps fumosorosea (strain ARSEF 2679) TaxID=1081104 RepID=A0A162JAK5_CORFA|nr:RNA polymerase III Rpc4 [Cordyceps fumosorosea ARSEF 2679]OAA66132.1 RNA polymerase III Rpc4 [Cordyceps fumosorosea ARSEF 2679]
MVRGRATARGTRRGAASAGTERAATDAAASAPTPTDAPAATSSETTPARRGGTTTTRATRAPAVARFLPKNVRRNEAERDSLARQEEKKASERAAEERKARGRSRFRSKRSRGDTMGRGGFGRIISGASGPFSSGIGGPSRGGGGWFGGSSGGVGGGGGGFGGRGIKSDSKGHSFAHGRDIYREARINADKLHIMSPEEELDSEDEAMIAALSAKDASKMPMGIYRKEHKEAGIVVATTAELEAKENATGAAEEEEAEGSLWVDGDPGTLPLEEQPAEEGVWGPKGRQPVIKAEPGTDDDAMDVDLEAVPKMEDQHRAAAAPAPTKVKKALPQDPESKMIQSDLDLLARELGAVAVDTESAPVLANKDGRLYLFQFPPLMPPLKESSSAPPAAVKAETSAAAGLSVNDIPAAAVDLTNENEDDEDDEDEETEEERAQAELKHGFKSQFLSQGGMIGRLHVRRSGRVELDWGGHVLEMSPAAGMNFLTTAVIVEESDEKAAAVGGGAARATGGDCVGMGKIMGRFTVAPVWSEEEDWTVPPEELAVPPEELEVPPEELEVPPEELEAA